MRNLRRVKPQDVLVMIPLSQRTLQSGIRDKNFLKPRLFTDIIIETRRV